MGGGKGADVCEHPTEMSEVGEKDDRRNLFVFAVERGG